jgi:two-component system phosphate regulon sensor histidine kinase PhoR
MNNNRSSRSLTLFYVLVIYVLVQFGWWAYHITELSREVTEQKQEILELKGDQEKAEQLNRSVNGKVWMILGEGSVFFLLLTLGIIQTRKSIRKEMALSNQQKNFLLSVTHELKSPIASTKLYLQTLQKRELTDEQKQEIVDKAIADTNRLDALVENMLIATKIDNSSFPIHKEDTDLSEMVTKVTNALKETTGRKHNTVLQVEEGISLKVDRLAFSSILHNLYENATKYAPPASEIEVVLSKKENEVVLQMKDQGIGMDPQNAAKVFSKFFREGNEDVRKTKGTGLGLYIVKHLVELHNGTIKIEQNQPKGSIFTIVFTA